MIIWMSLRKNERNMSVDSFITNVCINPTFMLSLMIDGQLFSLPTRSFKPNRTALHVGQRNQDWLERFPDQSQRVMSELKDSSINLKAFSQNSAVWLASLILHYLAIRVQDFYLSNRPNFPSVYRHSKLLELLGEYEKGLLITNLRLFINNFIQLSFNILSGFSRW